MLPVPNARCMAAAIVSRRRRRQLKIRERQTQPETAALRHGFFQGPGDEEPIHVRRRILGDLIVRMKEQRGRQTVRGFRWLLYIDAHVGRPAAGKSDQGRSSARALGARNTSRGSSGISAGLRAITFMILSVCQYIRPAPLWRVAFVSAGVWAVARSTPISLAVTWRNRDNASHYQLVVDPRSSQTGQGSRRGPSSEAAIAGGAVVMDDDRVFRPYHPCAFGSRYAGLAPAALVFGRRL